MNTRYHPEFEWSIRAREKHYVWFGIRLRVVSNFGDSALPSRRVFSIFRARVYFARATIAIAKIRDYSQSSLAYTKRNYSPQLAVALSSLVIPSALV